MRKSLEAFAGALFLLAFTSTAAMAAGSGAFRLEVPDAAATGKGSAFVGEANTPSAVFYNPAGLTQLKGNSISVGATLIQPKGKFENRAQTIETKMQRDSFLIPHGYFVSDLGLQKFAFGVGSLSQWGLCTDWAQDSFARYVATRSELTTYNYLLTGAYQLTDSFSIGVGVDIDDSRVDKQKKLAQLGGADGNFKLVGDDIGAGFRVAGMYRLNEKHQFGLMYRSAVDHKYHGKIYLDQLNASGSNYQAIFGGTSYETDVVSKSTLPQSVVLGYSFKPDAKWTFNADVEWMDWSVVEEEKLAYPSETNAVRLAVLNDGNPASRDWESVISAALGTQYNVSDRFRVRGGYYYHQSPIPGDTWELNLPDSNSHGITAGVGYDLRKDLTLDLAWSGIYYRPRKIDNTVGDATAALTGGIDGTYSQWTNLVYATVTYRF